MAKINRKSYLNYWIPGLSFAPEHLWGKLPCKVRFATWHWALCPGTGTRHQLSSRNICFLSGMLTVNGTWNLPAGLERQIFCFWVGHLAGGHRPNTCAQLWVSQLLRGALSPGQPFAFSAACAIQHWRSASLSIFAGTTKLLSWFKTPYRRATVLLES